MPIVAVLCNMHLNTLRTFNFLGADNSNEACQVVRTLIDPLAADAQASAQIMWLERMQYSDLSQVTCAGSQQ